MDIKLSNLQINKSKLAAKNAWKVTLRLSSNMICNTTDQTNFPDKLLLLDAQVSKLCRDLSYNSSANIYL